MKNLQKPKNGLLFIVFTILCCNVFSQTSWKGTSSTLWKTAANWTNGVPTSTTNAIIGDANFTGPNQPNVSSTSACNSLTIGGTVASTLTVSKALTISGNLTVNGNGTITHKGTTLSIKGNWSNGGAYSAANNSSLVNFIGVAQSIGGASTTTFRRITIATGSTVSLTNNITVSGASSLLTVSGTLNPSEGPGYLATITALTVNTGGVLLVKAASFAGNYLVSGATTLNAGSTVEYASTTVNQTVSSAFTYATLKISGSGTKSLSANLLPLRSTAAAEGNIYVNAGTFDLLGFTANRGVTIAGGVISVANNATLKIGGTNSFPINYVTNTLVVASTVEYSGTAQTVTSLTYGNLSLSSSAGAVVKTFPATALSVTGNFTSSVGAGTSVSYTAAANITITGTVNIGASTTFNAGSFAIGAGSGWSNNGIFTGNTSTVTLSGPGSAITGTGTHNFNNLTINASNITADAASNLTIAGNLLVTLGNFTHAAGGTLTMSGASKTISGSGLIFGNLTITGSTTTSTTFTVAGNLSVSGTLSAAGSAIIMNGAAKTISGAGTITFGTLSASGTISTAISFFVNTNLTVSGSFTATAGTVTFTGTSTFNGIANLYNASINGTSLQLATNAVLGIANSFVITAGTLNVTGSVPNTVNFNGAGPQNINAITYNNLILSNGNTKTAAGGFTVNQDLTIASTTTFNAGAFTHILYRDLYNNGTFTAGAGTIQFNSTLTSNIYGPTVFNTLTVNNASATTQVIPHDDISAATVNMTVGMLLTGTKTLTITNTRTGPGIIMGNILRSHSFTTGVAYAFEGPDNTITFSAVALVTSVLVSVTQGSISDFPFGASVNRLYTLSVPSGTYNATVRLHYEDAELNGNLESSMSLWKYNAGTWGSVGKTGNSTTSNYVELSGQTSISTRWTIADAAKVVQWNGSSSSDWNTAANWTVIAGSPSMPPSSSDIVQLGTGAFTNQPVITTAALAKNIIFGSAQAVTLNINSGGSLTTSGNIEGLWSANASHTINVNNQSLTINGDFNLSDGTSGRTIAVNAGTGTVSITGSLNQSGGAGFIFTGAGFLNIGKDHNYTSGTFTAGSSTTSFNGSTEQLLGGVSYNHLTINKTGGLANMYSNVTVLGNLLISAGELDNYATTSIFGNTTINTGAIFRNLLFLHPKGDWINNGTYTSNGGGIYFDGSGNQNISASTFGNFNINKPVGSTASLTGNVMINGDLIITSGILDIKTFTCNRSVIGGAMTMGSNSTLIFAASNLPLNFSGSSISATSTVIANGTGVQNVFGETFGHLILRNGGAKTLASNITVAGNFTIESGAGFDVSTYSIDLYGNWINNGSFTPSTGTIRLYGTAKTVTGNTSFYRVTVYGSYTLLNDVSFNNALIITASGSLSGGAALQVTMNGNLTNSGVLNNLGSTTFTGTTVQTLSLINAVSTVAVTVNFNGTVSPVLNSTSSPQFGFLNINNTGGINPSVGWTILYQMTVGSGASFNGGASAHNFYGSVTNNGTITSTGTLNFIPTGTATVNLGSNFTSTGTVNFGGAGAMTLAGSALSLQDVIIANTNAAGISPVSNWTIGNDFTISANSIFNAGSYTYAVAADLAANGTLNGGTSAFTMSGTGALLFGSPGTNFYDLIITGSVAAQSSFNVTRNFTNNNLFDASLGVIDFTGSGPSVIGGTASPYTISQIGIIKTGGAVVSAGVNIVGIDYFDIQSGTFDMLTFTLTETSGSGLMNIANNAVLKIGGTSTLPTFSSYAMDSLSTVNYAGTGTNIKSISALGFVYGNLTITGTGIKTADGALNIRNNFSLSNATFVGGNFIDTLGGNWSMTGGTYTNTNSTVVLNGTGAQDISSTGAFNNLTINKTAGSTAISTNITVGSTLNFTSGKIQTGSNIVVMPAGATVSGAAQGTGWVFGKLQKNFATGSNVTRTLEIGGANFYSPATILIASVSTAGNLTGNVTTTDQPNITGSTLNPNKSVNRYWTLVNSGIVFTTATITPTWVASDLDAGVTTSIFKAGNYTGTWSYPTVTSPLSTSIQASGITTFGDIAIAEQFSSANWTGSTSTDWFITTNWSTGSVPSASTSVTIPSGLTLYPVLNTGTGSVNNITIQTGATVSVTAAVLQIGGTISNSGSFNASAGTIDLNGGTVQPISGNAFTGNKIQNLIISNSAGVNVSSTANDSLIVTGVMNFGNVNNATLATGNNLKLRSTASATARVADLTNAGANSGNSISGNVTVERWIKLRSGGTGRAYRLLAPAVNTTGSIKANWMEGGMNTVIGTNINPVPLYGTQITGAAGNTNGFDVTQSNASSLYATTNAVVPTYTAIGSTGGSLNALTGYFLYVRGDRSMDMTLPLASGMPTSSTTLRTTGTIVQGTQTVFTNAFVGGGALNLITNPYPSPIDWSLVKAASSNITDFYTLYDPNFGTRGGFVTVSSAGVASSGLATKFIQSGQAFFVQSNGGVPAVSIQEIHKTAGNNNEVFLTPPPPVEGFRTELYFTEANNYRRVVDGAVALFNNSYSAAVDENDAKEINNWDENIAIAREGKHLAIEGRPVIIIKDTIPLFMNNMKQQEYEFEFTPAMFSNPNLKAELVDNFLNKRTLISVTQATTVSFTVTADAASKATDRFMVVFGTFGGPLAIDAITIKANQKNQGVQVAWVSKSETDMVKYEVERSAYGTNFAKLSTTIAIGNSSSPVSYNWFDANPNMGTNFYRVKAIDRAGNMKYSDVVKVTFGKGEPGIVVYPNPMEGRIFKIDMNNMAKGAYLLNLYNNMGQLVYTEQLQHDGSQVTRTINLKTDIAKGAYQLQLSGGNGFKTTQRIIKN